MMRKGVVFGALTFAATSAFASSWTVVDAGAHRSISIDRQSIVRNGQIVKVWVRQISDPPEVVNVNSAPIATRIQRWIFNCGTRQMASGVSTEQDAYGNELYSNAGAPSKFDDVIPDTVSDVVRKAACHGL